MMHLAHFPIDHIGLEGHHMLLEAGGQQIGGLFELLAQLPAHLGHVEALAHRDGHHDRRLALVHGRALGRIHRHDMDACQLTQRHLAGRAITLCGDQQSLQVLDCADLARRGQGQRHARGRDQATRRHDVLRLQLRGHLGRRQARFGQLGPVKIDVDLVLLKTVHRDPLHTCDRVQVGTQVAQRRTHLAGAEPRRGDGHRGHRDPTEFIVNERAIGPLGQGGLGLGGLGAHPLPQGRQVLDIVISGQLDDRHARTHGGHHALDAGNFTQSFFHRPGQQALDLLGRQAGLDHAHQRLAHGDGRLFLRGKAQEGEDATEQQHHRHEQRETTRSQRGLRQRHDCAPAPRREVERNGTTCWPSARKAVPAVTICSPAFRPILIPTRSPSTAPRATCRRVKVPCWGV